MKKPKIRFKGFTEDWEQRKLGDVVEDYVEKTTIENQYPVLTSSQQMGIVLQDNYFSGDRVSQSGNIGYFVIPKGYFAYRSRSDNDVFVFNRNDRIDKGIISYFYPVFKPNGVDSDFLLRRLNYGLEPQLKIASEGTGQHVLSLKKFKNMETLFPEYEEQQRIGEYFAKLDTLITLHQRKCDETQKLKKYMLQKMFPKNGATVPEIRFSGFTEDWEQRKLGEVFQEYSEKNHPELPALTIIQGGGTVLRDESDRNLQYDKSSLSGYKMVCEDDFIVHLRSFEGGLEKSNHNGLISPAYHTFHGDNVDSRFYYPYFRSYEFIKHKLVPHVYGIRDGRSIDIDGMKTIEIPWTSYGEQKKIGDYIESLDHLITLHQRKCKELQNMKKFMLQNMFV